MLIPYCIWDEGEMTRTTASLCFDLIRKGLHFKTLHEVVYETL